MFSLVAWQQLGSYVSAHRQQIFVIDNELNSDKLPVLLLHGYPRSSWDYSAFYHAICEEYRVITLDFLGFGFSSKPYPYEYSIIQQANIVEAVLAQRNISHCHVIAHNYGDAVMLELLARQKALHRQPFLSVTFLGSSLSPETYTPTFVQRALSSKFGPLLIQFMSKELLLKSFTRLFGPHTQPSSSQLKASWKLINHDAGIRCLPALLRYFKEWHVHQERWQQALFSDTPLALIRGTADPVIDQASIQHFHSLHHAKNYVAELPHIGHYPHLEAPHKTLNHWHDFLQQL